MRWSVAKAHLECTKALIQKLLGLFLHFFQISAIELAVVAKNFLFRAATEQFEDGLVNRFTQDVPYRNINCGDRRHAHALAPPCMCCAIHALVEVLVVPWVLTDHERRQIFINDGLRYFWCQRHVAQTHNAVVGFNFHHRPAVEAKRVHRVFACGMTVGVVVIDQIHGIGTKVALRRNCFALPFEDAGANAFDFHEASLFKSRDKCVLVAKQGNTLAISRAHSASDIKSIGGGIDIGLA